MYFIKSFCKVNLSLRVIKKLNNGLHKIQSLVTFINFFDTISIKEINSSRDQIKFSGRFKNNINIKKNSVQHTIEILRKYKFLENRNFLINVKKNIPHSAGLGGGSMNSAALLNFFLLKYKLKISQKKKFAMARKIGSDVSLGFKIKNTFLRGSNKKLGRTNYKLNLYVILVNPGIKCKTRDIYLKNKKFSKPYLKNTFSNFKQLFHLRKIKSDWNDLEEVVFRKYPKVKSLNYFIKSQKNCLFSRMTGSGSTCVGYFNKLVSAQKAKKNILRKFPGYWCVIAKTI